jgi:hypothetical protein
MQGRNQHLGLGFCVPVVRLQPGVSQESKNKVFVFL